MADIYGDVGEAPQMRQAFESALSAVWTKGVEAAVKDYLKA